MANSVIATVVEDAELSPDAPFIVMHDAVPYLAYATKKEADKVADDWNAGGDGVIDPAAD